MKYSLKTSTTTRLMTHSSSYPQQYNQIWWKIIYRSVCLKAEHRKQCKTHLRFVFSRKNKVHICCKCLFKFLFWTAKEKTHVRFPLLCPAPAYFTTFRTRLLHISSNGLSSQNTCKWKQQLKSRKKGTNAPAILAVVQCLPFSVILQKMVEKTKANGQWKIKFQWQKEGWFWFLFFFNWWPVNWISYPFIRNKTKTKATPTHLAGS